MDFQLIYESFPKLLAAVPATVALASVSLFVGFLLAVPVALARLSHSRLLASLGYGYVYVLRSTPLLVQMFLIYYGSGQFRIVLEHLGLWALFRDAWFCAILALSLNTAAYTSEIIRGGVQSVPWGQIEAARSIGMSSVLLFRRIVFPIAMRQALPAYGSELMIMIKSTSLASTITIVEVTGVAKQIISESYRPLEVFLIAGCIYLSMNFLISRVIFMIERRISPKRRDRGTFGSSAAAAMH
ncbi:ABC transporter permease [Paraburkholderia sp. Cpub6]|uniref:ABC transporter permease n=1 Tax=Paraburkholderia sp. Cpub6 TaxID=2723094 RepID=UPI0016221B1A|nr:ABC transporter permease [Paraburkholderia sp. Cpub6]MBB5463717.1 octopine/nopaline transport system permease protein [Paraburkholderia sp. Cpub6]